MAVPAPITSETREIGGYEIFLRRRQGRGVPTLFVHGNPTHSGDWMPFLRAVDGPAIAIDLPNFGRSERVDPARFDSSMHEYARFIGVAIDELLPSSFNLVVHDWGGIALRPAQRRSERVQRLVVINAVPLLAGYRWHWVARIWRRRFLGRAFNAMSTRRLLTATLRQARPGFKRMPDEFIEMVWSGWDQRTRDAVLRLYRSADPEALEAAGAHLDALDCPALVVWGRRDPYLGIEQGRAYADALPRAELLELDDAGHWPWIDRPELVDQVLAFVIHGTPVEGASPGRAAAGA